MSKLVDLGLQQVHVVDYCPIAHMHIEKGLDPVILFVKEIDLILQLLHIAFVSLLLILLCELVHVLSTLVELTQAKNLRVTHFNRTVQAAHFLF